VSAKKRHKNERYERFSFGVSPWVQKLTQRDLAELLGWKKHQLEALVRDKDKYVKRERKEIGSKTRNLTIPVRKLREIHERIKVHLNRIKQPDYLFSPRKGRGQRDNAEHHVDQLQFLSLDIRQFYPSTTDEHIFRWAHHVAGLRDDVAGLFTKLVAVDGKMPFGSPVSPVLTTLVHRDMFDDIYAICRANELRMSVWVDDLTISGTFVRGALVEQIRSVIRKRGLQTHKVEFRDTSRPVIITGVPIQGRRVMAPRSLHKRLQDGYDRLRQSANDLERSQAIDGLLSAWGTYRYHLGSSTPEGRSASNRMDSLRQRRAKFTIGTVTAPVQSPDLWVTAPRSPSEAPWD
jgi:RNA-directed DNA polymerase